MTILAVAIEHPRGGEPRQGVYDLPGGQPTSPVEPHIEVPHFCPVRCQRPDCSILLRISSTRVGPHAVHQCLGSNTHARSLNSSSQRCRQPAEPIWPDVRVLGLSGGEIVNPGPCRRGVKCAAVVIAAAILDKPPQLGRGKSFAAHPLCHRQPVQPPELRVGARVLQRHRECRPAIRPDGLVEGVHDQHETVVLLPVSLIHQRSWDNSARWRLLLPPTGRLDEEPTIAAWRAAEHRLSIHAFECVEQQGRRLVWFGDRHIVRAPWEPQS